MFYLAYLIIVFSYLIFILGLLGVLYKTVVSIASLVFLLFILYFKRRDITSFFYSLRKKDILSISPFSWILAFILVLQIVANFIGALGPELAFDALWYHLTIPKIFLMDHSVHHISGGLFYYSDMPKLIDMLYVAALSFGTEICAKIIHFLFGIGCLIVLYRLSRKFVSQALSLLVCVVFYSNLVVGWASITAYIDLGRTFFEILALLGFIEYLEGRSKKWLTISALMLGGAISAKLLAIVGIPIFLILLYLADRKMPERKKFSKRAYTFILYSLIVPLPYFVFSLINTGNPVYPLFSKYYPLSANFSELINPIHFLGSSWNIFTYAADPLSPVYIIFLPTLIFVFKKFSFKEKVVTLYCCLGFLSWYAVPDTGGGRFILAYLPAFSLLAVLLIKSIKDTRMKTVMIGVVIIVAVISIGYRGLANKKYIPVILGNETKHGFLSNNLNFSFGDFYDTDNYFRGTVTKNDKVLLYGLHNEYYVNFPFIDSSYVRAGDKFNYILTQNSRLPKRFSYWNLIYENPKTHVKLYSLGGQMWEY